MPHHGARVGSCGTAEAHGQEQPDVMPENLAVRVADAIAVESARRAGGS
jgi:hypothetical protein